MAVSTPRLMTALVEEAVSVGDLVRIFELQQGHVYMVELTLPSSSPYAGTRVGEVPLPADCVLVGIIREGSAIAPTRDDAVEAGDELLFITPAEQEYALATLLNPQARPREVRDDEEG